MVGTTVPVLAPHIGAMGLRLPARSGGADFLDGCARARLHGSIEGVDVNPSMDTVRFADLTLNLRERRVTRSSEHIRVGARAFDLLAYLVARSDQVVSRDEIMKAVARRSGR